MDRRDRLIALGLGCGMALLTLLPYGIATRVAPAGTHFAGFLLNPIDGFSYLAKMRQGLDGAWLFRLPYSAQPGSGVLLYPYYLLLGHLAGVLRIGLLPVLQAARVLAAVVMFLAIYHALEEFVPDRRARWYAYGLCLVGAGWGWMAVPFGLVASDLSIPETTPFLSAYANAHFPLALAAFVIATTAALGAEPRQRGRIAVSAACGAILALVLPFILLPAVAVLLVGALVGGRAERGFGGWAGVRRRVPALFAFLAGAAPFAVYDAWLLFTRPDLAGWTAQNQTPSPTPWAYVIGFAPLFLLSAIAFTREVRQQSPPWLLVGWAGAQLILLYAPLALQRRLSLGVFVPLAGLAAIGSTWLLLRGRAGRLLAVIVFASAIPSNLLVIAAGLGGVARGEPMLVQTDDEACATAWLEAHAATDSLVLAGETLANRLPAQAGVRVIYGHPYETPNAESERALVTSLYSASMAPQEALTLLHARGVDYVVFGPQERSLGPAVWPELLPSAVACGQVEVLEVPAP